MSNLFMNLIDSVISRDMDYKDLIISEVQEKGQGIIDGINNVNDETIKSMDLFATKISNLRIKMREAVDNSITTSVISGNSNSQWYINSLPIEKIENIIIKNDGIELSKFISDSHQIFDVSIYTNGVLGNSHDYQEKRHYKKDTITTTSHVEIESINTPVTATITLDFRSTKVANMISFKYREFGVSKPGVGQLEISKDGYSYIRISSNVIFDDDLVTIVFSDSEFKSARFTVTQSSGYIAMDKSNRFAVGIHSLKSGVMSSYESGEVIFGPLNTYSEILKASIQCSIPNDGYSNDNSYFYISNNKTDWYELSPPYTINNKKKVVDFNTILSDSISTKYPVKSIYLRVVLNGKEYKKKYSYNSVYNKHNQMISIQQPTANLGFDIGEEYIVGKSTGNQFGDRVTYSVWSDISNIPDSIEYIRIGDEYSIKTISSIGQQNKVTVSNPLARCIIEKTDNYSVIGLRDTDIHSTKIFKASNPIVKPVRISESKNIVIPFSEPAGIYTLTDGEKYRRIDLSSGYFTSCYQWAYQKHDKESRLIDPIGRTVHVFPENTDITLLDYFTVELPKYNKDTQFEVFFNKEYPHKPLGTNDFTIIAGKLVSSKDKAMVDANIVHVTQSPYSTNFGLNYSSFEVDSASMSKNIESLSDYNGKNIAKLRKTGIVKGTIKFDYSKSSVFSFVREVEYINGSDEFNTGNKVEVQVPPNVNRFSLGTKIDHFSDIKFIGYTETFKNKVFSKDELIGFGDFLLEDVSEFETVIILPEGINTHDIIDTKVIIDSPMVSVGNGYFSVDYKNGIIYSQTKIDGNTKIEYLSSNMYISGNELIYIDKGNYTIRGRSIDFSSVSDDMNVVIVSKTSEDYNLDVYRTPKVNGLTINVATA